MIDLQLISFTAPDSYLFNVLPQIRASCKITSNFVSVNTAEVAKKCLHELMISFGDTLPLPRTLYTYKDCQITFQHQMILWKSARESLLRLESKEAEESEEGSDDEDFRNMPVQHQMSLWESVGGSLLCLQSKEAEGLEEGIDDEKFRNMSVDQLTWDRSKWIQQIRIRSNRLDRLGMEPPKKSLKKVLENLNVSELSNSIVRKIFIKMFGNKRLSELALSYLSYKDLSKLPIIYLRHLPREMVEENMVQISYSFFLLEKEQIEYVLHRIFRGENIDTALPKISSQWIQGIINTIDLDFRHWISREQLGCLNYNEVSTNAINQLFGYEPWTCDQWRAEWNFSLLSSKQAQTVCCRLNDPEQPIHLRNIIRDKQLKEIDLRVFPDKVLEDILYGDSRHNSVSDRANFAKISGKQVESILHRLNDKHLSLLSAEQISQLDLTQLPLHKIQQVFNLKFYKYCNYFFSLYFNQELERFASIPAEQAPEIHARLGRCVKLGLMSKVDFANLPIRELQRADAESEKTVDIMRRRWNKMPYNQSAKSLEELLQNPSLLECSIVDFHRIPAEIISERIRELPATALSLLTTAQFKKVDFSKASAAQLAGISLSVEEAPQKESFFFSRKEWRFSQLSPQQAQVISNTLAEQTYLWG